MRAESAVLLIADQHSGKRTKSFNIDVLDQRMQNMKRNTERVLGIISKSYKISELVVMNLGDHIDNDSIYANHATHTDDKARYGREQAKKLVDIMQPIFTDMQKDLKIPMRLHGVRGNHGRVSKFTHEGNNWDLVYFDYLSMALKDNKKISTDFGNHFYDIVDVQDKGLLIYHGAGIKMYQGIPWYGITQRIMRWKQSMPKPFIAACLGHFHTLDMNRWIKTDIMLNGCAVSDDDFAQENLGMDGEATYWLFGVHPERGITWRFPIDLLN